MHPYALVDSCIHTDLLSQFPSFLPPPLPPSLATNTGQHVIPDLWASRYPLLKHWQLSSQVLRSKLLVGAGSTAKRPEGHDHEAG